MTDWSSVFYISIINTALMLSVLGLSFAAILPGIDRFSKRFFPSYFIILMACCFTVILDFILFYHTVPAALVYFILILECLLLSLPLPMVTVYLLHCLGKKMRGSRLLYTVAGLWTIFFILLISAKFIGIFFYDAPDNYYYRGPLYPLLLIPLITIMLLNLISVIRRRKQLSAKVFTSFLIAILPITAAFIVNLFTDAIPLLDISYVLSAMSMYSFILSDQFEKDSRHKQEMLEQQMEIANQRADILVLQMRPHFIYNTLTSIYALCGQNPKLARQVILDFTTYLRKNLTALASAAPIPFSAELEHTRAYLAVEQAQYEDSLFVEYDTPHTWFRVPPLTLQPIVENAIKHGRDPYAGPFHVTIRTRKTDTGSEIIVADNGRGFDLSDDSGPHIALKNIEQRLEIMCDGSLAITAGDGGGTVVTVTIPDSAGNINDIS